MEYIINIVYITIILTNMNIIMLSVRCMLVLTLLTYLCPSTRWEHGPSIKAL